MIITFTLCPSTPRFQWDFHEQYSYAEYEEEQTLISSPFSVRHGDEKKLLFLAAS